MKDLGRLSEAWSVKIEVVAWGKRREGEEGEGEEMGGRGGGGKGGGGEEREEVVQPLYKLLSKMDIQKKALSNI